MKNSNDTNQWHLTDYLISLGMSRDDARAWIRARREGRSFKANPSDTTGVHLDRIWKRKMEESEALLQLKSTEGIQQQHHDPLVKWRLSFAILSIWSLLCWMYVIAFQMVNPESPYWPLAVWLPRWVRMDYFGEANFIASFAFAIVWAKLRGSPAKYKDETRML